jgi:hypothetical protein
MDRLFLLDDLALTNEQNGEDFNRISKAVELLLAAKLMLRGHHISIPLQDDGIDLVVDYRLLVQVKSSASRDGNGKLRIGFEGRRWSEREGRLSTTSRKGQLRDDVDVLACYARDSEAWWFIPRSEIGNAKGISLTEHLQGRRTATSLYSSYLGAWSIFAETGVGNAAH